MYQVGDLLHINGQDQNNNPCTFYAEMVGVNEDNELEVYYLEQTKKMEGYIWSYAKDWDTVDKECVRQVFHPTKADYVKVYKEFGFIQP